MSNEDSNGIDRNVLENRLMMIMSLMNIHQFLNGIISSLIHRIFSFVWIFSDLCHSMILSSLTLSNELFHEIDQCSRCFH